MTDFKESFADVARETLRGIDLRELGWRHHGLGMLQGELSEALRVHLWHPTLVTKWPGKFREVHDHRFDLVSYVAVGRLVDRPFMVVPVDAEDPYNYAVGGFEQSVMFEIAHAKVQTGCTSDVKNAGPVWVRGLPHISLVRGDVYNIERGLFHTTDIEDLAVTLVHRSNFGTRPARVLGAAESAIVKIDTLEKRRRVADLVRQAQRALDGAF